MSSVVVPTTWGWNVLVSQVLFVGWRSGRWRGSERKKAHLNIGKAYDAPEIIENRYLRYGRRVET